jgi:uncharacterized protein
MGERTTYPPGTFCWTDLVTSDPDAASSFYADVLGWELEPIPGTEVALARVGGHAVASIAALPDPASRPGFNCYVSVESADATAARARELGGDVALEAGDVGAFGRLARITDPEGALLSLWQPGEMEGAGVVNVPGALTWNDLATNDIDDAESFYGQLFGWTFEAASDDPPYNVIHTEQGGANGGMMAVADDQTPIWVAYFATDDVAATAARAEEAGAAVINGPTDVPAGTFVVLQDPQGAVFCLFASATFDD